MICTLPWRLLFQKPLRWLFILLLLFSEHVTLAEASLDRESSAFLRAHASGPVNWLPWGETAFARAKREQKAVFVAVGGFTSELSRAMRTQTFSHAETAKMLNDNFICVLVDRDEHPEVASLYQAYLAEVKQLTGQPLNIWLTPELLPFEGGAYLPPTEEWGKTSFSKLAQQVIEAWKSDPAGCRARGAEAAAALKTTALSPASSLSGKLASQLAAAVEQWRTAYDSTHAGFGEAPKSTEPELLRFLLRQSPEDRTAALTTLRAIAASAMRDPLDGGFFRYASDAGWKVPYLQKNLTDQTRLALAFLDAASGDDRRSMEGVATRTLDFVLTRLAQPNGTFIAAEDATVDEFHGYYTWAETEIDTVLGADAPAFKKNHGVEADGNVSADDDLSGQFKGRNLLRSPASLTPGDIAAAARLLAVRAARPTPPQDERATAGAHGLLLAALSRAGGQPGSVRYLDAAGRLFETINREFILSSRAELRRFAGSALPAAPVDYVAVALGCREFARTAHREQADKLATRLLVLAGEQFFDASRGRYYATAMALPSGMFVRPLPVGDVPSAESLAIQAGAPPEQIKAITASLTASLEEVADPPSGDLLLALYLINELGR